MRCLVLAAAVCACGDNRSPRLFGDAGTDGPADGSPDAAPDARDPTVRVHVLPIIPPGILFFGPDGHQIAAVEPDANGLASAPMPDGGIVIAVPDPLAGLGSLRAIYGVVPGDDINLIPVVDVIGGDRMAITVPPRPNTDVYRVAARCGDGGGATPTFNAFVDATCPTPMAMLVHAEDQFTHLLGAFRDVAQSTTSANLSGTYLDPITLSVTVSSSVPLNAPTSSVSPILEGRVVRFNTSGVVGATTATTTRVDFTVEDGSLVDARSLVLLGSRKTAPNSFEQFQRILAPGVTALAFDHDAEALPFYVLGNYTPATRTVAWTRTTTGAPLAGQSIQFAFENFDAGLVHFWNIVVPPNATEVTLPVLEGAALQEFDPNAPFVDTYQVVPTGVRSSSYQGFDDFRRNVPVKRDVGSTFDISTVNASPI